MSEYIKRDAAIKAVRGTYPMQETINAINDIPAADVVEVTRDASNAIARLDTYRVLNEKWSKVLDEVESMLFDADGNEIISLDHLRELADAEQNGCEYYCDDTDGGVWECSKCGAEWYLESGNPFEYKMRYCAECGRPIRSIRYNEWYYESDEDCGDREVTMTKDDYLRALSSAGEGAE